MIVDLPIYTWQLLRLLVRAAGPLTGRELRHKPTRWSVDGTFLDEIVAEGLIEVAAPAPPAAPRHPWRKPEPAQFRTLYRLTEKGKAAAEYGEYDRVPRNKHARPTKR